MKSYFRNRWNMIAHVKIAKAQAWRKENRRVSVKLLRQKPQQTEFQSREGCYMQIDVVSFHLAYISSGWHVKYVARLVSSEQSALYTSIVISTAVVWGCYMHAWKTRPKTVHWHSSGVYQCTIQVKMKFSHDELGYFTLNVQQLAALDTAIHRVALAHPTSD